MKVNDYVRTDKGLIGKVIKKEEYDTHTILEYEGQYCKRVLSTTGTDSEIIKSSPNIIDLIEVGDYVNGCKIIELSTNIDGKVLYLETDITEFDNVYACGHINIYENDIKSIVTKEMFSSVEYRVEND